jgi:DNA-binding MarR family transcriptional regulator
MKMLTKIQFRIMQVFVSSITKSFSTTDISRLLNVDYKNVHIAMKSLVASNFLILDHNLYRLNYKANNQNLAYIEHLRSKEFLKKKKNSVLRLFVGDILKKIQEDSFIFIIFGSTVSNPKPRDTDILMVVDSIDKVEAMEKQLHSIAGLFTLNFDIQVLSHKSVYEGLEKRDENNLINMILDKHLIVYGAETFYRLLGRGRK